MILCILCDYASHGSCESPFLTKSNRFLLECVAYYVSPVLVQAWLKLVQIEREEAEKERKKDEEERRKRKEETKRRTRILEAAFDGDNDEILAVLDEVLPLILCFIMNWFYSHVE